MFSLKKPGSLARRAALCAVLGGLAAPVSSWSDEAASVSIDNFTFAPDPLTVGKGTLVTWTNHDDIPHSIVLATLSVHSKAMDTDQAFSYRFDKAGVFSYVCGLHPHMQAKVVVK